jgi:hypothetical protein
MDNTMLWTIQDYIQYKPMDNTRLWKIQGYGQTIFEKFLGRSKLLDHFAGLKNTEIHYLGFCNIFQVIKIPDHA